MEYQEPEFELNRPSFLRRMLTDLNLAIVPKENRISALKIVIEEVNHNEQDKHDEELDVHADRILFQKLAYAMAFDKSSEEVELICCALEMVYRASRSRVATAFNEFGLTVLPLIMMLIEGIPRRKHNRSRAKVDQDSVPYPMEAVQSGVDKVDSGYSNLGNIFGEKGGDYISLQSMDIKSTDKSIKSIETFECSKNSDYNEFGSRGKAEKRKGSILSRSVASSNDDATRRTQHTEETYRTEEMESLKDLAEEGTKDDTFHTEDMNSLKDLFSECTDERAGVNMKNPERKKRGSGIYSDDVSEITGLDLPDFHRKDQMSDFKGEESLPAVLESDDKPYEATSRDAETRDGKISANSIFSSIQDEGMDETGGYPEEDNQAMNGTSIDSKNESPTQAMTESDVLDELEDPPNKYAVFKILKVLRYFSRVLSAMVPLAHYPGLLDSLLYQLEKLSTEGLLQELNELTNIPDPQQSLHDAYNEHHGSAAMTLARIDTIAILVNLACAEENKVMMVDHPGLLESVINTARNDPSDEAREHSAIVIMNLSYSNQNKEVMAEHDQLLSTLTKLMGDTSPYTRKYAASALFALACVVSKAALLATYCGPEILEALRQVLLHDPSDEARMNASEALFNMARSKSGETALTLGRHPNLLDALAEAVISDYSADVRAYCARALEWLSAEIHYPVECHQELLRALIKGSQWTKTASIAEGLKTQASIETNRRAMGSYPGMMEALARLALLANAPDEYVRSCALSVIERLSIEPENRPIMAKNQDIMSALTLESFRSRKFGQDSDTTSTSFLMKSALKNLANVM